MKTEDGKVIYERSSVALGLFDGVHAGHQAVIRCAAEIAHKTGGDLGILTFGPQNGGMPKFGGRSDVCIMDFQSRIDELFRAAGGECHIDSPYFSEIRDLSPEEFFDIYILRRNSAANVVCGEDFRFGRDRAGDTGTLAALCKKAGIGFETVPPVCIDGGKVSSTRIRENIRNGDIPAAKRLLGHDLYYTLEVLHGKQLGRTIGFPTVNQELPAYMARPKRGVYAGYASVSEPGDPVKFGALYPAITNIGVKPTVKDDETENMETHLIGFDGDIYGRMVRVYLNSYIREERRFESLDELREQLEADRQCALTQ